MMLSIKSTLSIFLEILCSLAASRIHFIQDNNIPKVNISKCGPRCVSSSLALVPAFWKQKYHQPHGNKATQVQGFNLFHSLLYFKCLKQYQGMQ